MSEATKRGFKKTESMSQHPILKNFTARLQTVATDFKISSAIGFLRIKFMHEAAEVKFQDASDVKLSKSNRGRNFALAKV